MIIFPREVVNIVAINKPTARRKINLMTDSERMFNRNFSTAKIVNPSISGVWVPVKSVNFGPHDLLFRAFVKMVKGIGPSASGAN